MAISTIKKSRIGRLIATEIYRITEANQAYIVPEDCWMTARLNAESSSHLAVVYVNGINGMVADVYEVQTMTPVFKGDVIRTREYGNYLITFFKMGG